MALPHVFIAQDNLFMNDSLQLPDTPPGATKLYHAGTLTYTPWQLVRLFAVLLLGGFSLMFIGIVQNGGLFTLSLNYFHANAVYISIVLGSIPAALNMIVCPIVSFRSDRNRSRIGRRKPYILISVPIIALAIAIIGWAPEAVVPLASWLQLPSDLTGRLIIGFFLIIYSFFYMFVGSVYYYLYADVVPEQLIGRFNSCFMVMGYGSGIFFNFAVRNYVSTHLPWVYTIVAAIVFIGLIGMALLVKEGTYPPVTETTHSPLKATFTYLRECFGSNRFYWWFFIATASNEVSVLCRALYNVLFVTKDLQIAEAEYFKISGIAGILAVTTLLPLGWLVDWLRPLRVYILGMIFVIGSNLYAFFFCIDSTTYMIVALLLALAYCIQNSSNIPLFIEMLPKDRYGQFCSAQAIFRSVLTFAANFAAGEFILCFGYRYLFVWDMLFTLFALFCTFMLMRAYHAHGGPKHFVAP